MGEKSAFLPLILQIVKLDVLCCTERNDLGCGCGGSGPGPSHPSFPSIRSIRLCIGEIVLNSAWFSNIYE